MSIFTRSQFEDYVLIKVLDEFEKAILLLCRGL